MKKYIVFDIVYQEWFSDGYELTPFEKYAKVFNTKQEIEKYRKVLKIRKYDLRIKEID